MEENITSFRNRNVNNIEEMENFIYDRGNCYNKLQQLQQL